MDLAAPVSGSRVPAGRASQAERYRETVPHHLEAVRSNGHSERPAPAEDDLEYAPLARPTWWRWVAIAVIVALVLAGPLAVVLYRLLT
jgi:hypothetical protein